MCLGLIRGNFSYLNLSYNPAKVILSPGLDPSGGLKIAVADLSLVEEHKTIPLEENPANFLAFKLAKTQTNPVIYSKGMIYYKPEAISLSSPSPQSIYSHHNLSDSGCFQTFFNSPTLISIFYSKYKGSVGSNYYY